MTARGRTKVAGLASLCVAAALFLAALGVVASGASARGAAVPLLPNLVTRPIVDVHIEKGVDTKLMRFSTIVGNRGPGPAELFPDVPDTSDCDGDGDPDNDRIASQRSFKDSNGNGTFERGIDVGFSTKEIGCFIFHPQHHHWHFEEFERYELRRIKSGKVLASSEKVSFCLLDTGTFGSFPGTPGPYYGPCNEDVTMGLSVGWSTSISQPGGSRARRSRHTGRAVLPGDGRGPAQSHRRDERDRQRSFHGGADCRAYGDRPRPSLSR